MGVAPRLQHLQALRRHQARLGGLLRGDGLLGNGAGRMQLGGYYPGFAG